MSGKYIIQLSVTTWFY